MSILTKKEILDRSEIRSISFKPGLDQFQVQAHSIDLRLGYTFMIPKMWHMTPHGRESLDITHFDKRNNEYFEVIELEQGQYFELLPGEYILVSTLESIRMATDLMGVLYPRSSTNRKGLSLDLTGLIDAGYERPTSIADKKQHPFTSYPPLSWRTTLPVAFEELKAEVAPRESKYHQKDHHRRRTHGKA